MAPRTQYDLDQFRRLLKNGNTRKEIMAKMSIKYIATFNGLKLKLMETDKKFYAVKDNNKMVKKVQKAIIGKNNNLTLSSKMLENRGFKAGDAFAVKVTKNKIVLTLVEE